MKLMIAAAGAGKTHWLRSQHGEYIDCTHKSHRAVLCSIADTLAVGYETRASIDDLITYICAAPPTPILLDNIDRPPPKLCYSLLTIAAHHDITATATDPRRVSIITDRAAAQIVPPPRVDLTALIPADLPHRTAARIRATAHTPAAVTAAVAAARRGDPLPTPPPANATPIIALAVMGIIYLLRYDASSPVIMALLLAVGYVIRRIMWHRF